MNTDTYLIFNIKYYTSQAMSNIICEVDITDIVDAGEDEFETESFSIEFSFIMFLLTFYL